MTEFAVRPQPSARGGEPLARDTAARGRLGHVGLALFALAAASVSSLFGGIGDYASDAAHAVDALARGHLLGAMSVQPQPAMGFFAILVRAPFVAVAHWLGVGSVSPYSLASYRIGVVPCLAAAGLLAVFLGRAFPAAGRPRTFGILAVLIAVASPVTTTAISLGHPEEALGAALCVGATVAAIRDRWVAAAILLGLAMATKQWGVIALPPTVLAIRRTRRWQGAAVASALAGVLLLPQLLVDSQAFSTVAHKAAATADATLPQSWWYLVARTLPHSLAQIIHPGIVVAAFAITLLAHRRGVGADRALPLLALLFLVRCTFDTMDNYYYHLPLVMTLLAWDAQSRRRLPYATVAAVGLLVVTNSYLPYGTIESAFYLAWTLGLAAYLISALWPRRPGLLRTVGVERVQ